MKPAEAIGMIVFNRRFGRSIILSHEGGLMFRLQSTHKYPGVRYTTSWGSLKRERS